MNNDIIKDLWEQIGDVKTINAQIKCIDESIDNSDDFKLIKFVVTSVFRYHHYNDGDIK